MFNIYHFGRDAWWLHKMLANDMFVPHLPRGPPASDAAKTKAKGGGPAPNPRCDDPRHLTKTACEAHGRTWSASAGAKSSAAFKWLNAAVGAVSGKPGEPEAAAESEPELPIVWGSGGH